MFKKLFKTICITLLAMVFITIVTLTTLKYYPQFGFWLIDKTTGYQVSANKSDIDLWPLSISFSDLSVIKPTGQQFIVLHRVTLKTNWLDAVTAKSFIWHSEFAGGSINLTASDTSVNRKLTPEETVKRLNIHALLSVIQSNISDVRLIISKDQYLNIDQLNTQLVDQNQITQTIQANLSYGSRAQEVGISGSIESKVEGGISLLNIKLAPVDLSPLINSQKIRDKAVEVETAIDWNWLPRISPLRLQIKAEKISARENQINDLDIDLFMDGSIVIDQLQAAVNWRISEQTIFNDNVSINGSLKPLTMLTTDADLRSDMHIRSNAAELSLKGTVNINGMDGNDLKSNLQIIDLPIEFDRIDESSNVIALLNQYLPMELNSNIKSNKSLLTIEELQVSAGQSDLNGNIIINMPVGEIAHLNASFNSSLLSYQSVLENNSDAVDKTTNTSKQTLFSEQVINWDWLNNMRLSSEISVDKLRINQFEFEQVTLPIQLHEGKLSIENINSNFSQGSLNSSLKMQQVDTSVKAEFSINLLDGQLESSNLIPKDQVSGGAVSAQLNLSSTGASVKQLAESLSGDMILQIQQAEISNKAINLVGSDLIMEMINKLNPFVVTDPSTKLNCAVAKSQISQGQIMFADSLVIETDKMSIVADGKVDLAQEQINLSFNPRAQSGLGVNAGTLVKFVKLGGPLSKPAPVISATGLLKTGVAIGAAVSTGGASIVADGMLNKISAGSACEKARNAFKPID